MQIKKIFSQIQQLDYINLTTKIRSDYHTEERISLKLHNFFKWKNCKFFKPKPDYDCSGNGSGQNLKFTCQATLGHIAEQIAISNELARNIWHFCCKISIKSIKCSWQNLSHFSAHHQEIWMIHPLHSLLHFFYQKGYCWCIWLRYIILQDIEQIFDLELTMA